MFQKILVPINPLEEHDLLIKTAFAVGIEQNAKLYFIYLGEDPDAIGKLEGYMENCRQIGLNANYESVKFIGKDNEIPKKIAEFSEDFDLVIMGHLKFDKVYRFVHQSTAADLINILSIPVMVIPEEGNCEFILDKY
jgi:nucleotide-binding universal stress UspA family protein